MASRWALAFNVAATVTVFAGAILRGWARAAESAGRRRRGPLRFASRRLGGLAVVVGVGAGSLFAPGLPTRYAVAAGAAIGLAVVGVVDDHRGLPRPVVLLALVGTSVGAHAAGMRIEPTGIAALDATLTVAGIVLVTMAFVGLGSSDGLAAGVGAVAGAGIFAITGFGDQEPLAALTAAVAGGSLGFLVFNLRPASLFAGRAMSLFVGFTLAVAAVEVDPAIGAPGSFAVPLLVTGLLLVDVAVVAVGRLRHGRPPTSAARDHLSHRLRVMGASPGTAVAMLVAVQLVLSTTALFVARGVLAPEFGAGLGGAVLALLVAVTARAQVHREAATGFDPRLRVAALGVLALAAVAAVPSVVAGVQARRMLEDGRAFAEQAIAAARRGDSEVAAQRFAEATEAFDGARDRLGGPLVSAGLAVPVLGSNVAAARELADAGVDLSRAGRELTAPVDPEALRVRNGTVPLDEVRRIAPELASASVLLEKTRERMDDIDTALLLPPVTEAVDEVSAELTDVERDAVRAAEAARLAPAVLGGDGPRRYFVAVQNPAELRGTGGFIGQWGILTAENGKVSFDQFEAIRVLNPGPGEPARVLDAPDDYLRRYGRFEPDRAWQNVNMAPSVPVVGRVVADLAEQSGAGAVDGVLFVDPYGLAALLELTGPVTVAGWPEPITAENVVEVTLRDAYAVFAGQEQTREEFLGDAAETVLDVASEDTDLGRPARIAEVLGAASRQGHLALYFTRPGEQRFAELIGSAGLVAPTGHDALLVTTQNAGANKIDYYLEREVDYQVRLSPDEDGDQAIVSGSVDIRLRNGAPAAGLPQIVIGSNTPGVAAGENRSFVTVYSPFGFTTAELDGAPVSLETDVESGLNTFATFIGIPAGSTAALSLDLHGTVDLDAGRWYTLELPRQPSVAPDTISVRVEVAPGWRIAETVGADMEEEGATGRIVLRESATVRVRLEPTGNLWQRLVDGP